MVSFRDVRTLAHTDAASQPLAHRLLGLVETEIPRFVSPAFLLPVGDPFCK
jgi:hypothetical protein